MAIVGVVIGWSEAGADRGLARVRSGFEGVAGMDNETSCFGEISFGESEISFCVISFGEISGCLGATSTAAGSLSRAGASSGTSSTILGSGGGGITASSIRSSSSFLGTTFGTACAFAAWAAGFFIWVPPGFPMPDGLAWCAGGWAGSAGAAEGAGAGVGAGEMERAGAAAGAESCAVGGAEEIVGIDAVGERAGEEDATEAGAEAGAKAGAGAGARAAGAALRGRMGLLLCAGTVEMGAAAALGTVGLVCCLRGETFLFFPSSANATTAALRTSK